MNGNPSTSPGSHSGSSHTPDSASLFVSIKPIHSLAKLALYKVAILILALVVYSIYAAVHKTEFRRHTLLSAGENRLVMRQHPTGELPVQLSGGFWRSSNTSLPSSPDTKLLPPPVDPLQILVNISQLVQSLNTPCNAFVAGVAL